MSYLYLNEMGITVSFSDNRIKVKYKDGLTKDMPIEMVEGITALSSVQLSGKCIQEFLLRGIPVLFFSKGGSYFGRLQSTGHVNAGRQRLQSSLYETDFSVNLSKQIVSGKIHNQEVVLRRYAKSEGVKLQHHIIIMQRCREKVALCKSIEEIMGFEGYAAKTYFDGLASVIEPEFTFSGRTRRPPKDEFNSLISLGYSILMNLFYGALESKGLNPYFGFLHRDHEKHPTLASDMMEEWRAVIVDSTAMAMINGHEIHKDDFYMDYETGGCMLTRSGLNGFIKKLESKLQVKVKYLSEVSYPMSFRQCILYQIEILIKAMETGDAMKYRPIIIR